MSNTKDSKQSQAISAILLSMMSSVILAVIKGLAGVFGHSYALIADAIESTADVFSSFLVLLGLRYANKPADHNHPYGHGKIEPLVTFVVVGFLVVSAVIIAIKSIQNIQTPHRLPAGWTLIVLALIIAWKECSFHYVMKKAISTKRDSLKADAWHHRSDAITSVAAFIGISMALFLGDGYEAADDWAALFAAGLILYNSFKIFRPALGEIMDEQQYEDLHQEVHKISESVEGIQSVENCMIRKAGVQYHLDLDAIVDGNITVKKGHDIAHELEDHLRSQIDDIGNVQIHIEPDSNEDKTG